MTATTGGLVDSLGVALDLEAGDLVASAVLIVKVVKADGEVALGMAVSDGCSWIEQLGLVTAAANIVNAPGEPEGD